MAKKNNINKNIFWESSPEEEKIRIEAMKGRDENLRTVKEEIRGVLEKHKREDAIADLVDEILLKAMTSDSPLGLVLLGTEMLKNLLHPAELSPSAVAKLNMLNLELAIRYYGLVDEKAEAERRKGANERNEDRKKQAKTMVEMLKRLQAMGMVPDMAINECGCSDCDGKCDNDEKSEKDKKSLQNDPMVA